MAKKPLNSLKKGLDVFKRQVQTKKAKLEELQRKGKLSDADEKWLDHEGNIVDEQLLLNKLEATSDYNRAMERLDNTEKILVQKLQEFAGDVSRVIGTKRKGLWLYAACGIEADIELNLVLAPEKSAVKQQKQTPEPVPVFTKKENATLAQRIKILDGTTRMAKIS